jgi:hypothetical protein
MNPHGYLNVLIWWAVSANLGTRIMLFTTWCSRCNVLLILLRNTRVNTT